MPNGKKHPDVSNDNEWRMWVVKEITKMQTYMRIMWWPLGIIALALVKDFTDTLITAAKASGG